MEPRIFEGDLALVRRQQTLESGELGVVVFGDDEGTLKKYIRRGNTVILQPFTAHILRRSSWRGPGSSLHCRQGGRDTHQVVILFLRFLS